MPASLQSKVLHVLRRHEISGVGENSARPAHIQFVASSKRPLRDYVATGSFRDDLFYELAQLVVDVPPLRSRREEIPFFVDAASRDAHDLSIQPGFIEECMNRNWPGNVRELVAAVRGAATAARACGDQSIAARHLSAAGNLPAAASNRGDDSHHVSLRMSRDEKEAAIVAAYRDQPDAAAIAVRFGIGVATVYRYVKRHGGRRGDAGDS